MNKPEVSYDEFQKLELRIGKVLKAKQVEGSKKLIHIIVDFGEETRQAVAGLLQWYNPEDLVGKKYAFVLNLERRTLMGIESQCMILAAEDENNNLAALQPEREVAEGSKIC